MPCRSNAPTHDCCLRRDTAARAHRRLPCRIHRFGERPPPPLPPRAIEQAWHAAMPHVPSPLLHLFHAWDRPGDTASRTCLSECAVELVILALFRNTRIYYKESFRVLAARVLCLLNELDKKDKDASLSGMSLLFRLTETVEWKYTMDTVHCV